jgi:vacuole morphology and inheritance protein 14
MVAKLPKIIDSSYCLNEMKKEIEVQFICQHIVNEFNERVVEIVNSSLLLNFVHAFIMQIENSNSELNLYFCENFIEGKYEKYNNNAGW